MAKLAPARLIFEAQGCPDPGQRIVDLPPPLASVGDDFDWNQRDYDGFRDAILAELQTRFPERKRWTPADLEVVLVEVLATVLDQLSDAADRVASEGYLETARRPEFVYRLLQFIGVDPARLMQMSKEELLVRWEANPYEMEAMRRAGPSTIRTQKRMVSLRDYGEFLADHPLVERARAGEAWGGSWTRVRITVGLWNDLHLDDMVAREGTVRLPPRLVRATDDFHGTRGLRPPKWNDRETFHDLLRSYVDAYRPTGQEVVLERVVPVGVDITLCVTIRDNYFRSEVIRDLRHVLGRGPYGFFRPGRLRFGEDLHGSDFYQRAMELDGVRTAKILVLKRVGNLYPNHADLQTLPIHNDEVAVCDNDPTRRERGLLRLSVHGGRGG